MKISLGPLTRPLLLMFIFALLALSSCTSQSNADEGATAQAKALIASLSLRESAEPISEHPRWAPPQRIAVVVPNAFRQVAASLVEQMQQVAGGAKLIIINSNQPTPEQFAGADVVIGACTGPLAGNTGLRWVHSYPVGVEKCLPILRAMETPPILTNGQRLTAPNISEHVIALMMMLKSNLHRFYAQQLERKWEWNLPDVGEKREVAGSTMLVVGLGGIGTEVARRAAGLGMHVIATRKSSRDGPQFVNYVGLANELNDLAGQKTWPRATPVVAFEKRSGEALR